MFGLVLLANGGKRIRQRSEPQTAGNVPFGKVFSLSAENLRTWNCITEWWRRLGVSEVQPSRPVFSVPQDYKQGTHETLEKRIAIMPNRLATGGCRAGQPRRQMLNTQCSILNAQYSMLNTQCSILNAQ